MNLKKADKGTTTVVMNKEDKIKEGQNQLDITDHYQPLDHPTVVERASKVTRLIETCMMADLLTKQQWNGF